MFKRLFNRVPRYSTAIFATSFYAIHKSRCNANPPPITCHIATHSKLDNLGTVLKQTSHNFFDEGDIASVSVTINTYSKTCAVHNTFTPDDDSGVLLENFKCLTSTSTRVVYEWIEKSLLNFTDQPNLSSDNPDNIIINSLTTKLNDYTVDVSPDEYPVVYISTVVHEPQGGVKTSHIMVALNGKIIKRVNTELITYPQFRDDSSLPHHM